MDDMVQVAERILAGEASSEEIEMAPIRKVGIIGPGKWATASPMWWRSPAMTSS